MVGLGSTVPYPLDSFIGRKEELQAVRKLLETHRLVTLTGAAGIGKTRLALRIAEELSATLADGVCFVGLVLLKDPALVPQAVASALGLREQFDRSLVETLTDSLASRNPLLVWDNCDYLMEGCRALAQALLGACPQVKILATSRRSLRVQGEALYAVRPFSFPGAGFAQEDGNDAAEMILAYEAPRLFNERAAEILTGFAIRPEDAPAVTQICRRLDGIPLALELAAGRVRELSVQQIAARLDERFALLTRGASTTPHQQTLRTAIDWSHALLSEAERTLLARLSVFAGGWELETAEQVCSGSGVDEKSILDLLTDLIDKSWVSGETRPGGGRRYRFLESIRRYGEERLAASGEEDGLRARHADYFLALAEQADAELTRSVLPPWLDRLEVEYENLRAAMTWYHSQEGGAEAGLRLARALVRFWEVRGHLSEGRAHLTAALGRQGADQPSPARAKALNAAAVLAWMQGDSEIARALFQESLTIERALGDTSGTAWSMHHLGHVAAENGDYATARTLYADSLAMFREQDNPTGIAASLADQGNVALKQGDHTAARSMYEESLRLSRDLGNRISIAVALNNLGKIAREQGDTEAARAMHVESLTIRRELGDRGGYPWSLEAFARLAAPVDPARAARLWGAAEALRKLLGLPLPPNEREEHERQRSAAREAFGEAPFATAWEAGQAMSPEQAVAYALQGDKEPEPHAVGGQDRAPALPLLATKLALPPLPPGLLPRPRLMARLDPNPAVHLPSARVALLDASPGSGKSSLVRQWCELPPPSSVAWLSLDREDNDPARFLGYLCAAIETVSPAAAAPAQALLSTPGASLLQPALTLLLNGVAVIERPVILVLDDYHEIEAPPVHELLAFLVEHLPPTLFLILTTRSDPPLPLARQRLRGQLVEIRDEELRFTPAEATAFLNERMGLSLPPEAVARLVERTEGWAAGLQMAALSLQSEPDPDRFLDALAGTHRFLVEYLLEEVLQRQPPDVQAFLGRTAFLDRLSGPLCDAVTGEAGGQVMLQRLTAANLFLVPLDQERRWYRYHHLFGDVLRARLLSSDPEEIAARHGAAAAWYEAQGMIAEAVEHALAGELFDRAGRLIERQIERPAPAGEVQRIAARLEQLLETGTKQGRPANLLELRLLLAKLHWSAGRAEEALAVLEPALALAEGNEQARVFINAGPSLVPVLRQAAAQGIAPETVGKLLAGSAGVPPASSARGAQSGGPAALAEPLSDRELEVLRLVAAGLANAEIAAQLFLAVGTVKRHVFNLYGKLGANSRTSAVARARELGLL